MYKFNGDILRDIREAFGFSRKQLSVEIGVSEQAVGQYETGVTKPDFNVMNELRRVFMVGTDFFQLEESFPKSFSIEQVAFRSTYKNSIKKATRETAYLNLVNVFIANVGNGLVMPEPVIDSLRREVLALQNDGSSMNVIGQFARKSLGIDANNSRVIPILEKAGIFIVEREVQEDIDAYSGWSKSGIPIIVLGSSKKVAARRNFDVAHELGHLLFDFNRNMTSLDNLEYKFIEKRADEFASTFLLDFETFPEDYKQVRNKTNPDSYGSLKKRLNVSIQALAMRASALELIDKKTRGYFWGNIRNKKYKEFEPYDDELTIMAPGKLKAMLNVRAKSNLPSVIDSMSLSKGFLHIFGIDEDSVIGLTVQSSKNNVVDLFR